MNKNNWKPYCENVIIIEHDYIRQEKVLDETKENLIINLEEVKRVKVILTMTLEVKNLEFR